LGPSPPKAQASLQSEDQNLTKGKRGERKTKQEKEGERGRGFKLPKKGVGLHNYSSFVKEKDGKKI